MKHLFSIRQRENTYRFVLVSVIIVSAIVSIVSLVYAFRTIELSKKNIYVMTSSNSIVKATSTDITNSYDILMKAQIEEINKLIYQQVPDDVNMNAQIKKAFIMGDKSVVDIYDLLKQKDYYSKILNQNYYTILNTDSIQINYSQKPYQWRYYGKLKIVRGNATFNNILNSSGWIEDTGYRTKLNERGLYIKNMRIDKMEKE